jgi:polyisoprenyl-teichoic acid--peptidoglycan teichoic acid transferase
MPQKLKVPPPPAPRSKAGRRPAPTARRSKARRSGCRASGLVPLALAIGLLLLCLLLAAVPALLSARERGRLNLLLLGVDRRSGEGWDYRTDTILILTLDPNDRTAGMLSIPRDLQITIPGHGQERINLANVYGFRRDSSDGGPALLKETIAANFGIPIDQYLMIDFSGFERIVDALGGIDVDVPKVLHDTRYPDPRPEDPYAFRTVHFDEGQQHMNGRRALVYARSRMSTSDFDRARRQQLVLLAIRHKALSLNAIPRWPSLAVTVIDAAKTDMDLGDFLALAFLVAQIDGSHVQQVVLDPPLVVGHRRADGAAVQLPNWDLINPLVEEMFGLSPSR